MVTICHNMQHVTCVIMLLSLHTNRFWPPRKSRLAVDKQGIRKAETFYPQLLIGGLITLRVLQLEGNLGSASSSLPTVAPENTPGGVALAQPRSFGIFRLCTCVCIWGQQHALRSLELRHDSNEGATRSPAHSKAVHFKRKCPPDTSLTCTWGSMVRRETPLKLLWSPDLDHPTEGWWKSRVRTSRPPLRAAYSLLQSFQSFSIILDSVQVKGGPIHWLFVYQDKATATNSVLTGELDTLYICLKFRLLLKLCAKWAHPLLPRSSSAWKE